MRTDGSQKKADGSHKNTEPSDRALPLTRRAPLIPHPPAQVIWISGGSMQGGPPSVLAVPADQRDAVLHLHEERPSVRKH